MNSDAQYLIDSIQAGCFQNVVNSNNNCNLNLNTELQYLADYTIYLSNLLYENCKLLNIKVNIRVYRGMRNIPLISFKLNHPIPFSTTLSYDFACKWIENNNTDIVLVLDLDIHTQYIVICSDIEQEIILPPCNITINYHHNDNNNINLLYGIIDK